MRNQVLLTQPTMLLLTTTVSGIPLQVFFGVLTCHELQFLRDMTLTRRWPRRIEERRLFRLPAIMFIVGRPSTPTSALEARFGTTDPDGRVMMTW